MIEIKEIVHKQHRYFETGKTLALSYRREALIKLFQSIKKHEYEVLEALRMDLNNVGACNKMYEWRSYPLFLIPAIYVFNRFL